MLKVISNLPKTVGLRFSTKVAEKPHKADSILIENDVNGMRVITIKPKVDTISHLVAVFNAGSRYETYETRGMNHLLRRSAGLSCGDLTPITVTRHLQQMGANLRCIGTRETLSYQVTFSFDMFEKVGEILSHLTTRQKFYNWELKNDAKPLMETDIQYLNRRDFDTLCSELLHKAAFRDTLGNSLFADEHHLGHWNLENLENFVDHAFSAHKSMLIGVSVKHEHLIALAEKFKIRPLTQQTLLETKFRGGEIRKDLPLDYGKVSVAWEAPGFTNIKSALAASVLAYALDNGVNHRIKWNNGDLELIKRVTTEKNVSEHCVASALNICYSDRGLLGFTVTGEPDILGEAVSSLHKHFIGVGKSGVAKQDFDLARKLVGRDIEIRAGEIGAFLEGLAAQGACGGDLVTMEMLASSLAGISVEDVNQVAASVLGDTARMALAGVGDLSRVPFVADLH